ncbi:L,D-transpeptidase family protein [Methylocaldum szegediense]|uniref:L,D-transpeptidase YcbB n=1 Tax=Methylocaldum szegediense TaxID=73780 RepID=A0ABN8X6Q2_9GAMM|nr:L,D-transpeptidase family protein [Methylocaldum szegediense]CAI8856983.1 L,D-transpeptidase YcbB [Methylocaldum szegediense]
MIKACSPIGVLFQFTLTILVVGLSTATVVPAAEPEFIPDTPTTHIRSLLKEGTHPKLRWGKFSDYQVQLEQLYGQNGLLPLWFNEGRPTPQAKELVQNLAGADSKGLNAEDYDAELLGQWLSEFGERGANPREIASADVALSLAAMRYVSNLYIGRINPNNINYGLNIEPKRVDLPNLIQKIAQSPQPTAIIETLEPTFPIYERLKEALSRYQRLVKETPQVQFSFPAKFKPGDRHKDVPALRQLLHVLGDLEEIKPASANSQVYGSELVQAVKRFQQRHGLTPDGVIGKSTLNQLNFPLTDRLRQIQLGLERLRWLPERISGSYLVVNIPSFQLFGFRNGSALGKSDLKMNVIVGESVDGRHTPVFHSNMTYIIFRPYWNLPYKITVKEMLPQILRNPGYLAQHNLELVPNFSPNAPVYEPTFRNIEMLSTGALKLRQKPGPKNALGLVKFAFPNHNNIYLHSTPSKGLFKKARRDFSHGCIRVEDPVGLAEFVLADQGEWTRERIESAMNGSKPKTVTLKHPVPVYIFYSTVFADEEGSVSFYDDIYGHDLILSDLLAKGFPYPS